MALTETLCSTSISSSHSLTNFLSPLSHPTLSVRLHDPTGLHRATAAPVSALSSAGPPAEVGVPPPAGPGQRHPRTPPQPDHRQHPQLPLRPHPHQRLDQHQRSPSGPLPGEHPTGVRRPGAPGLGWVQSLAWVGL